MIVLNTFLVFSTALFGAIIGSFINMAAYRLPRDISLIKRARSFCPQCEKQIAWYDNIPILGFLNLRGRCRNCQKPIPPRYLLTELLTAALFALSAYQFFVLNNGVALLLPNVSQAPATQPWIIFAVQLFLIADMMLLSVVDLEAWLIPIETTLYWIPLGFILAYFFRDSLHPSMSFWTNSRWLNALIDSFTGLVLGAGILWAIGFMVTFLSYFRNRLSGNGERPREGMGMGDVHLLGMVGALLGWKPALATIFIGVILGTISGVSKMAWEAFQRRRLGDKYKSWQPTYEMPEDAGAIYIPSYWSYLVMGGIVLLVSVLLWYASAGNLSRNPREGITAIPFTGQMWRTSEEMAQGARHALLTDNKWTFDVRLAPVYAMFLIGLLMVFSFPFMEFLKRKDMLPQGSIVENDEGDKEEVLEGNYIPFGPSLALAALLVAFYDPLIRSFAFWFSTAGNSIQSGWPYHLIGEEYLVPVLDAVIHVFNTVIRGVIVRN